MAKEDIQKKWEERIAAFRSSGEKAVTWCKANHVDRRGLYTWMKRLGGLSTAAASTKPTTFVKHEIGMWITQACG